MTDASQEFDRPEEIDDLPELPDEESIEMLRQERDEARDKMLRAYAELENFRNRSNRERAEERKYASMDLFRSLLPVWDNINRTLEAAEKTHNIEALIEGIQMVEEQMISVFAQHGCVRIDALGQPFDPNFHASISQLPSDEHEPNTVMHESQAGFKLYDRIVRPAQVVLAAPTGND